MSFIGLLLFAGIAGFMLWFAWKLASHLFQILGWITGDISNILEKLLGEWVLQEEEEADVPGQEEVSGRVIPRRQAQDVSFEPLDASQQQEDVSAPEIPRRQAQDVSYEISETALLAQTKKIKKVIVPKAEEPEVSLLELVSYDLKRLYEITERSRGILMDFIRRVPGAFRYPFPVRSQLWYLEMFLCFLPLIIFFRVPDVYGYGPVIMALLWGVVCWFALLFLIYFLRVLIPIDIETFFKGAGPEKSGTAVLSAAASLRGLFAGVSFMTAVRRVVLIVFFLGLAAVASVEAGTFAANFFSQSGVVQLGATLLFFAFLSLVGIQLLLIFRGRGSGGGGESAGRLLEARSFLYALIVIAVSALVLVKLIWAGFFVLGFFYSFLYFIAFRKQGDPRFTLRRFVVSWLIFGLFVAVALVVFYFGGLFENVAGIALAVIIFISVLFIHTLWIMGRKYELRPGLDKLPLRQVASWSNLFLAPFLKLAISIPLFYFIVLFFSINTAGFTAGLAVVTAAILLRSLLAARVPRFLPSGLFAGYMLLVWISIFFVQTYNRIPPTPAACATIGSAKELRPVWTMAHFQREPYLYGALPYDAIADTAEQALFVTFKNLTGHGAVVRLDLLKGEPVAKLVTEDEGDPAGMFYPERLCINRGSRHVYSTTKTDRYFQILDMDYGGGGLELAHRIHFEGLETTNCQVLMPEGDIFVIFLGPPDSHLRVLDGNTRKQKALIRFGRFGYADYFSIDAARDRIVVPSLDPANRFKVYEVSRKNKKSFDSRPRRVAVELKLFGDRKISVSLPTLGVAYDSGRNRFYFTCPFLRLVLEVDGDSFKVLRYFFAGRFPREIAVNERDGLLLVANYSGGTVDAYDLGSLRKLKRYNVGKLVRSIEVDPDTGRTFAVTACGVFELKFPVKSGVK